MIFSVRDNNFISLLKSEGDIKSHGDSFYKITDKHDKICTRQTISQISLNKDVLIISGVFEDCSKS